MPELLLIIFMKVIGVVVGNFYDTILIKMMFDFTQFFIKTSFIFEIKVHKCVNNNIFINFE